MAIYGGVLAGLLTVVVFAKKRRLSWQQLTDIIVPALALAQAIGRWGNFFNMEAYGKVVTDPCWQVFPLAVCIPTAEGMVWHQGTFFYESCWNLLVFGLLAMLRKHHKKVGNITWGYFLLYGAGRILIEPLREDSLLLLGMRVSQWLSLLLCVVACLQLVIPVRESTARRVLMALPIPMTMGYVLLWRASAAFGFQLAWVCLMVTVGIIAFIKQPAITEEKETDLCQQLP